MNAARSDAAPETPFDASLAGGAQKIRNAMSIDVEEWFQVWSLSSVIRKDDWNDLASRVEMTTRRAIDAFDEAGAKATFFILGCVAERHRALVREIATRGHEVASHGWDHAKVFDQTREAFRAETIRAKQVLEDAAGAPVRGYRAAGFSIDARTPWAHEVLAQAGHLYSSSTHPIAHDHYGDPNAPRFPYRPIDGEPFTEIPVATLDFAGRRVSCAGGGWFRIAPYAWSRMLLNRLNERERKPAVFYFHPWEIDPGQPRVKGLPLKSRLRHYSNLGGMEGKLRRLLHDFAWGRIDETFGLAG